MNCSENIFKMTFEQLHQQRECLLLECISGSRAYNLQVPTSDTDIKGIFILPRREFFGMTYTEQVANTSNDEVYFEIKRFMELLDKNNPNILELLNTQASNVLYKHPIMDHIRAEDFLSKLCLDTFAGYAKTQIRKAVGLNKKMNQSFEKERKPAEAFCYVVVGNKTIRLQEWLTINSFSQQDCGLTAFLHFRDAYALYHQRQLPGGEMLSGIFSGPEANEVSVSKVPTGISPLAVMHFNKDGYSIYCKEYKAYWDWVEKRNDTRFEHNKSLGKNYDAKHMMHTFRLLNMAEEIALYKEVRVFREDRDFLLSIRNGIFEYDTLLEMANAKLQRMETLYNDCDLPDRPDSIKASAILLEIREQLYRPR